MLGMSTARFDIIAVLPVDCAWMSQDQTVHKDVLSQSYWMSAVKNIGLNLHDMEFSGPQTDPLVLLSRVMISSRYCNGR